MTSLSSAASPNVDLAGLFEQASRVFDAASTNSGFKSERSFSIAGQVVRLVFGSEPLIELLTPALAHLAVPERAEADLTVRLWDSASTNTTMPPPPWSEPSHIRHGQVFAECDGRFYSSFRLWTNELSMLDVQSGHGLFWTRDARAVDPYDSGAAPIRNLLHWWMTDRGFTFLHAGAVGSEESGALIVGPSGSGKSTSSLACLSAGMRYLGDDYCLLDDEEPWVHSLYSSARLDRTGMDRIPDFRDTLVNEDRMTFQKGLLFLQDACTDRLLRRMRVSAILVPEIRAGDSTRIEPISRMAALRALAPSSLFQLPGAAGFERRDRRAAFRRMTKLVQQVPTYRMVLGGDPRDVPPVIRELLHNDRDASPHTVGAE